MSEGYYEASLDHPCASCKCLQLDDARLCGKVEVDSSGTSRVSFGRKEATVDNEYRPAGDDPDVRSWTQKRALTLGYHRKDKFPNLSSLAKTASQGCEFCAMLRQDLLSVWSNNSAFANVRARVGNETESKNTSPHAGVKNGEETAHRTGLFGDGFPRWTRWHHGMTEGSKAFGSTDGTIIIYRIKCQYRYFTWEDERGLPWLDSFVVCFRILDGWNLLKCSLSYNVSTDLSDKCAEWLNIWRQPVVPEALRLESLERMNCLLDEAIQRVPPPTDNLYLPTRLIDVGSHSQPTLRLVVSKDDRSLLETVDPVVKRYVALSYCWGSREDAEKQLKTTRDTLNDHLHHLQYEKLPQTIADAVELCRALNIRYLWVDALCIIQGDSEDWAKESFEMSNVYANSFWTLCVLRGQSCLDGFLHPRKRCPRLNVSFRSALDASVSGRFYLSLPEAAHINVEFDSMAGHQSSINEPASRELQLSAWAKRAWTFQEAHLSKRMILFGDRMFYVSCGGFYKSEDGSRLDYQHQTLGISQPIEPDQANIFDSWYEWVCEYSSRRLTVPGDRLTALSAMARIVSKLYPGQRYLAGLWEENLHRGLLWTVWYQPEGYMQDRKNEYIAPSWSWACNLHVPRFISVNNSLNCHFTREFELCDAKVETDPGNPFGRVSAGHILLKAKVFRVPLGPDGRPNNIFRSEKEGYKWLYLSPSLILHSQEDKYIADLHFDCDFRDGQHVDGFPKISISQLWMVYISSSKLERALYGRRRRLKGLDITCGLLLIPNENGDGFLKVGLFYSENRGLGGKKFWEHIQPCEVKLV